MGILAALLRRRPVRHAQHRAASAGAGACRRLVPRAHSAGRRAAVGARGRSAARHPPTRHAPRPAAVGVGALDAVDLLRARWPDHAAALREKLALTDDELADWRDAVARIVVNLDPATGIYEQFAGFHALEPLDLAAYADRTVPIDVVIGRQRTQRSQVVKQADVVALIALLPEEFPGAMAETNFRYYEPRCAHGSSLSTGMHALVRGAPGRCRNRTALPARDRGHQPRFRP